MPLYETINVMDAKAQRAAALQELAAKRAQRLGQLPLNAAEAARTGQRDVGSEKRGDRNDEALEDSMSSASSGEESTDDASDSCSEGSDQTPQQRSRLQPTKPKAAELPAQMSGQQGPSTSSTTTTTSRSTARAGGLDSLLSDFNQLAVVGPSESRAGGNFRPAISGNRESRKSKGGDDTTDSSDDEASEHRAPISTAGKGALSVMPAAASGRGTGGAPPAALRPAAGAGALVLGEQGEFVLEPRVASKLYPHQVG